MVDLAQLHFQQYRLATSGVVDTEPLIGFRFRTDALTTRLIPGAYYRAARDCPAFKRHPTQGSCLISHYSSDLLIARKHGNDF